MSGKMYENIVCLPSIVYTLSQQKLFMIHTTKRQSRAYPVPHIFFELVVICKNVYLNCFEYSILTALIFFIKH